MKECKVSPGDMLVDACERLVAEAQKLNTSVWCSFNSVIITATPDSVASDLVSDYKTTIESVRKNYETSPAGLAAKEKNANEVAVMQKELDSLVEKLKTTYAIHEVLALLKQIQPLTDRVGVVKPVEAINAIFSSRGFTSGMNCGQDLNVEDEMNFAGYIIGQCMSMLNGVGAIHPVVIQFIDNWEKHHLPEDFWKVF